MSAQLIKDDLRSQSSQEKAKILQRFFKTGAGEYGEGDIFIGVTVPKIRSICKKYKDVSYDVIHNLLSSPIHEERLLALLICVFKYEKGDGQIRKKVYDLYLQNTKQINNWDLVDLSCVKIVGHFLLDKPKDDLYRLVRSENLWERRIAIVSTWRFIKDGFLDETIKISESLLSDKESLIHKAVGWMLREVGKKNLDILETFLKRHYQNIPRTTLRYAIERFPEPNRKMYLKGTFVGYDNQ